MVPMKSNQVNPSEENPHLESGISKFFSGDLTTKQKIIVTIVVILLLCTSIVLSVTLITPNNVSILKSTTTTTAATTTTTTTTTAATATTTTTSGPGTTLEGKSSNSLSLFLQYKYMFYASHKHMNFLCV